MSTINKARPKLDSEAAAAGLTILGPERISADSRYRFSSCGHEQELAPSAVRQVRFRCQRCLEAKVAQEAATNGMTLLRSVSNTAYRRYRFLDCGHEIEAQITRVHRRNVRCPICTTSKPEAEATSIGIELVGPCSNAHVRRPLINARVLAAVQDPIHAEAFDDRLASAAWTANPSWYLVMEQLHFTASLTHRICSSNSDTKGCRMVTSENRRT